VSGRRVAAVLLAGVALLGLRGDNREQQRAAAEPAAAATETALALALAPSIRAPARISLVPPGATRVAGGSVGARLLARVQLRARPGGRVLRTLGPRTGYGSRRVLAVVARQAGWLGVLSHYMPNSRPGWIPSAAAVLRVLPYTLRVDLSARELLVRRDERRVRRISVAIGRPGSTTPTGRFAVTDALRMHPAGGPYGCCALALTGRQPNLPRGWNGGDRIAIHGTTSEAALGTPASAGCLRASNRDMRWLMARVPLGATVRIRA